MRVTSLGFTTDLMVRRLSGSTITEYEDHIVVTTPANPGFYWGNFLLLDRPLAEGDAPRIREQFAAELPNAKSMAIGIEGADNPGAMGEVEALGLEVLSDTVLSTTRVQRPAGPPRGLVKRLATDFDWDALDALREVMSGPPADEVDAAYRRSRRAEVPALVASGAGAWFGVYDNHDLVSALGIVSDGSGVARYQVVETHPDHRRRGHARHLLHAAADHAARELAAETFVIVADPGYHAIDLYRSAGFSDVEPQVRLESAPAASYGRTAPM